MLVKVKRQNLYLEQNTAAKYEILLQRVFARTGKLIFITEPYGANRTDEIQGWLRRQWELGVPGFFYAAKPKTPQANHTKGCAFDINNWRAVGEQVIIEEAEKLGLVRDPSERWHWNNPDGLANLARPGSVTTPGLDLAGLEMEEIDMPLDKKDLVAILTSEFEIAQNGQVRTVRLMDALGAVYFYGDHLNARMDGLEKRVDGIDEATALRVWEHPITRADRVNGKAIVSPASAMIGTMQVWVDEIKAGQAKAAVALDPSIDEAGLVAALKASGFDPDDIAVVVADELDRRDREALDARTTHPTPEGTPA